MFAALIAAIKSSNCTGRPGLPPNVYFPEALADRSLAMYWSCDADNAASIRVANKVGFGAPHPFQLLLYRPLPG